MITARNKQRADYTNMDSHKKCNGHVSSIDISAVLTTLCGRAGGRAVQVLQLLCRLLLLLLVMHVSPTTTKQEAMTNMSVHFAQIKAA